MKRHFGVVVALTVFLLLNSVVLASAYDFNGETVVIATVHNENAYFRNDPINLAYIEQVERDFNVKIEFQQVLTWGGRVDEIMASVMAGDPAGDIVYFYTTDTHLLAEALRPVDVLDESYWAGLTGYHADKSLYSYQGVPYAVPVGGNYHYGNDLASAQILLWNVDFFEENGLENPYELMLAGEWTWDKFLEICKQATADTDGDGQIDQWGVQGWDPMMLAQIFAFTNNGSFVTIDDNGKAVFTGNTEPVLEALNFVHDLNYVHRVMYPETIGPWDHANPFYEGRVAFFVQEFQRLRVNIPHRQFEQGVVFLPKGPRAEEYVVPNWANGIAGFPVGGDKPVEALAELVAAIYKTTDKYNNGDYRGLVTDFYIDHVDNEMTLEAIDMALDLVKFWDIIPHDNFAAVIESVVNGDVSAASAMEQVAPEVQAGLDALFN
ncbi:MAG TPA: extracellular solute-binding protein [Firmicutes bacterium]|nr:extracellular solute-binding protein [Bacillota bacterium]